MNPVVGARLRIALLLVVAVVLQTSVGADLRVFEVAPDLMMVVAICAGLAGGTEAGAWVGFCGGLLTDAFLTTPIGLSALTYCLVGAAIGALRSTFLQDRALLLPVVGFVGTFCGLLLFLVAGDILGQTQLVGGGRSWLIRVLIVESLWSALLTLPMGYLYPRVARGSAGLERMGSRRLGGRTGRLPGQSGIRAGAGLGSRLSARTKPGSLP